MKSSDINYIVIHCSATKPNQDIGYAEIDQMHKAKGWAGCGYHVIIRQDGIIEMGRGLTEQGAHVGNVGHNHDSWGVCLVGGLDASGKPSATFSSQQLMAASLIVQGLLLRAPKAEVLGHRDLSPDLNGNGVIEPMEWQKQCPCFDVRHWWKQR